MDAEGEEQGEEAKKWTARVQETKKEGGIGRLSGLSCTL